jgi:ATP-dependent helicase YprA (DUF1998 family)
VYSELHHFQQALQSYIEATYHLSHPELVALRRDLLRAPGCIAQEPYIESTPRYEASRPIRELNLPREVRDLLSFLGSREGGRRIFDPPYSHQSEALESTFSTPPSDLVVTTGTGSGKTETFLLPILAHLAHEAATRPDVFGERAMRALVLYPMNALVNDQLGRLRLLFGAPEVREWFTRKSGRPVKFARYTGRTLYPGLRTVERNQQRLKTLKFYTQLETQAAAGGERGESARRLITLLKEKGKWPAKASSSPDKEDGTRSWFETSSNRWCDAQGRFRRAVERLQDSELLLRHEVHETVPDLLVTNYSMLEYMLLRPIERSIFSRTRDFYARHPQERLLLILDEAHLYRGAAGTEVALLIRRLRSRLALPPERLQVICTSASFSNPESAAAFAAGLVGKPASSFKTLTGSKHVTLPSGPGDELCEALARVELSLLHRGGRAERVTAVLPLLEARRAALTPRSVEFDVEVPGTRCEVRVRGLTAEFTESEELVVLEPGQRTGVTRGHFLCLTGGSSAGGGRVSLRLQGARGPDLELEGEQVRVLGDALQGVLFQALKHAPVVGRLLNLTSGAKTPQDPEQDPTGVGPAQSITRLATRLFQDTPDAQRRKAATDALVELASLARSEPGEPPLLAARVHAFFRGLPGLWVCLDPDCSELPAERRGQGPTGALYAQPRRDCTCGARVFELHTCRDCGLAVLRGFANDPVAPTYLWSEEGGEVDEVETPVGPLHVVLEDVGQGARPEYLDPVTGRLGNTSSARARGVWLPQVGNEGIKGERGLFARCPRCTAREKISDHQTKGDEPFQQLVTAQLLEQPRREEVRTPLQGRKALIFSDGRQSASRLSGNLKRFSLQDSVRPLLLRGLELLEQRTGAPVSLQSAYVAFLAGGIAHGVTARPLVHESGIEDHEQYVRDWLESEDRTAATLSTITQQLGSNTPAVLNEALTRVLSDPHTGLEALALATFSPHLTPFDQAQLTRLPSPPAPQSLGEAARKEALLQLWCQKIVRERGLKLPNVPTEKIDTERPWARRTKGRFSGVLEPLLSKAWYQSHFKAGTGPWLLFLQRTFGEDKVGEEFLLNPGKVMLQPRATTRWRRCERCTAVQPASPLLGERCMRCDEGPLAPLDPHTDEVFRSRKGHYRRATEWLLGGARDGYAPHPFVAEEHTAQLNGAGQDQVFSRAEWYEMRFQDIDTPGPNEEHERGPVDVLSCTTTMEVGIDIGSLTAVALRNVPPTRANYQQRAGRAGRRGSRLATVITYAGADSHDQRFFADPAGMVSGPVRDPLLTLDNAEITLRHAAALILGMYQQEAIPDPDPDDEEGSTANVFESLGGLEDFRSGPETAFSYRGLERWLERHRERVHSALRGLLPQELLGKSGSEGLVERIPGWLLEQLRSAGASPEEPRAVPPAEEDEPEDREMTEAEQPPRTSQPAPRAARRAQPTSQAAPEGKDEAPPPEEAPDSALQNERLLDRLFERGLLPRYAFPTDVVTFHVFDEGRSTKRRAEFRYSPQQGLNQALSQYAPGREVYIDGQRHWSFALWTPFERERGEAYQRRRLYFECGHCGYARLEERDGAHYLKQTLDCPACKRPAAFGPAEAWVRPPGFAHPVELKADATEQSHPPATRPTSAKLSAPLFDTAPVLASHQTPRGSGYTTWAAKEELIITNLGAERAGSRGFRYCPRCGRAEPEGWEEGCLSGREPHPRPNPDYGNRGPRCEGQPTRIVLGNRFRTDVALLRFRLAPPFKLLPGSTAARVVLTTVAEALASAAVHGLQLEPGDIAGAYRPALGSTGHTGQDVEVYLYDLTPGGAGFVQTAVHGTEQLLRQTLALLEGCRCMDSCYECLRSYQNRFQHVDLDRFLGASLLRHCLEGTRPEVPQDIEDRLLRRLQVELNDSGQTTTLLEGALELGGRRIVVAHPLAPELPGSQRAEQAAARSPLVPLSQLLLARALPEAALRALSGAAVAPPPRPEELPLPTTETGVPVVGLEELASQGLAGARARAHVRVSDAPARAFVAQLNLATLEESLHLTPKPRAGSWLLFEGQSGVPDGESLCVISRTDGRSFQSSGRPWTVGRIRARGQYLDVGYSSRRKECRPERVPLAVVQVLGRVTRVLKGA